MLITISETVTQGKEIEIEELTLERQCEDEFIQESARLVARNESVLSLACGAGVQAMARRFETTPILPGVNTTFIGVLEKQGLFTEECSGCGDCELDVFGGVCPFTRCAKKLLNGPAGQVSIAPGAKGRYSNALCSLTRL